MKVNIGGDFKGDVTGRNKSYGSEIEIEKGQEAKVIDLGVKGSFEGDITGIDKTTNSKKRSKLVAFIVAIGTTLTAIAAYYFSN